MRTLWTAIVLLVLLVLAPACWASSVCASAGAFTGASAVCCAGLYADGQGRCQYPQCKQVGEAASVNSNGTSNCCFGLAAVGGACRIPTLQRTSCALLGDIPTSTRPCCVGLAKASTGNCQRNTVAICSATQIASCCYNRLTPGCGCYCPTPYFQ